MQAPRATTGTLPFWWPWPLAALLFSCTTLAWWPGTLIGDSANQLIEIHTGHVTDWHSPMMSRLWQLIGARPQSILVLDGLIYWSGVALLADQLRREAGNRWALAMIAVGLSPLSVYYLGVIQKDTLMVALLVLAAGLGARFGRSAGIVPAILGMLCRVNAVFAVPPLLIRTNRLATTTLLCLAVSLALIPVSIFVNRNILGAERSHVEKSLELYDLAGVEGGQFARCYQPFEWDTLQLDCHAFDRTPDDLTRLWLNAISAHPFAYASHRISFFNHAIFFLVPARQECVYIPRLDYSCSAEQAHPLLRDAVSRNPFFWPVTWLLVGLFLLALPLQPLPRMLALSGTIYGLAYLLVGVASGFRYFYWTELSVQVALVWQLAHGLPRWRLIAWSVLALWLVGYAYRYVPLLF